MKVDRINMRIILAAVLLCVGQAASAADDCKLSDTLKRVHASSVLMFDNPFGGIMESNLRRVRAEFGFLDANLVTRQISQQLSRQDSASVLLHFHLMMELVTKATAGDQGEVQALLLDPKNAQIVRAAGSNIAKLGCISFPPSNDAITQNDASKAAMAAASGNTSFFQASKLAQSYGSLVGLVALGVAFWGGNRFISQHVRRQRSRAKRYYLYMYVSFATGPANHRGAILDISRLGTKLRHRGSTDLPEKAAIKIQLNGDWHAGKVMWASDEYCGIKFDMRLSREDLRAIRQAAAGKRQPSTQTAPQTTQ